MNPSLHKTKGIWSLLSVGVILFLSAEAFANSGETSSPGTASDASTFFEENCSSCHTIGGGEIDGPDLKGILERRKREWVIRYIHEPDVMREERDPTVLELRKQFPDSEMPNLEVSLKDAESLVNFLSQTKEEKKTEIAEPQGLPQGDAIRGRALFMGLERFAAGGPSCISCHPADGTLGGSLGPSLSDTPGRLGAVGLASALRTMPYKTMKPVYRDKPTESEQGDLAAYLVEAAKKPYQEIPGGRFHVRGFVAFVVLLASLHLIWIGRCVKRRRAKNRLG